MRRLHENRRKDSWIPGLVLVVAAMAASPSAAAGLKIGDDDTHLKIALLLQGWAVFSDGGAPNPSSLDTDFYLRRMRVLLFGQLNDSVNFFVETDAPNFGKQGDLSTKIFVQDAWSEFNLHDALQIDAGMILAPFSHHGMQGAVTLHSLDYHTGLIRYPTGGHMVWRDFGVMVRGLFWKQRIEYRLAVLNGVHGGDDDPRNPNDWPRLTGRLTFNLFEAEGGAGTGGFFYDGLYLASTAEGVVSPKRILSLGASADWQKDLNVKLARSSGAVEERGDYFALAADVFLDLPLDSSGRLALSGQVNFYYYNHGDRRTYSDLSPRSYYGTDERFQVEYSGYGLLSEMGLRYDAFEALVSVDWFQALDADGDAGALLAVYGGFNWWWLGHTTSIKLQAGGTSKSGGGWGLTGQVQAQLLF